MLHHLREMGLGMPLEVVRGRGGVGEGLVAVLLGTADVHIAPPSRFLAQEASPPPEVLCAFELLLREAGGVLSDACGEPIDLLAEVGHVGRCGRDVGEVGAKYRSTCWPRWARTSASLLKQRRLTLPLPLPLPLALPLTRWARISTQAAVRARCVARCRCAG